MRKFIFLLTIFVLSHTCYAANDTTKIISPEGIGKNLADLLIHRGDLGKSPMSIDINRLFPNQDLSEFEDSPAMIILSMLYGQQLLLPQSWDKLLFQADSLNIDEKTKYLKTYFTQLRRDQYSLICILNSSSKYYTFTFDILEWENNMYIVRLSEKLREYGDLSQLEKGCFEVPVPDFDSDISEGVVDSIAVKKYNYNQSYNPLPIEEVHIASSKSFIDNLTFSIQQLKESAPENICLTSEDFLEFVALISPNTFSHINSDYGEELKVSWKNLILQLKEKENFSITSKSFLVSNVPLVFGQSNYYHAVIDYTVRFESDSYEFFCAAVLVGEKWKLLTVSSLSEKSGFSFQTPPSSD